MTDKLLGKILACILAVMLPAATLSAETHAAMLYATNSVILNGVAAERSTAIFAGDNIQTPANGAVRLTAEGSTVVVGPSSNLVYEGDSVRLRSGSTMVTTDKGIRTQVQQWLVVPAAQGRSSYRVARGDGQIQVAALHGALKVSDGNNVTSVAEGSMAAIPDPEPQGGASPASTGGGSHKALIIGVGAGVATGVALLVYETTKKDNKAPLSPQ
jgi:hypothetical protein